MSAAAARYYRPEVDGLRAIAVLPVLFFHGGFSWASGGFVGVDVFFVISGYLISSILLRDLDRGSFSLTNFYVRRMRRILPALLVMVACCIPIAWQLMSVDELDHFFRSVGAVVLFFSNVFFFTQDGYFAIASEEVPLLHTWSLAVEEQFYIVFPLVLATLYALGRRKVAALFLLVSLGSLFLAQAGGNLKTTYPFIEANYGYFNQPTLADFYLPTGRIWELLTGAILALHRIDSRRFHAVTANIGSTVGLLAIVVAVVLLDRKTPYPSLFTLLPVLGTALIIAYARAGTAVYWLLTMRPLVGIGLISFSVYLWHQPLLAFARLSSVEPVSHLMVWMLLGCSVGLGYLSWRFVEQPCRQSEYWTPGRVVKGAVTASVMLGAVGLLGNFANGFPNRLPESARAVASSAVPSPRRTQCQASTTNYKAFLADSGRYCHHEESLPATIAVLGDSYVPEIAQVLSEAGAGVLHLGFDDCPPAIGFTSTRVGCNQWTRHTLDLLSTDFPDVEHVLMVYRHTYYLYGDHRRAYPKLSDLPPPIIEGESTAAKRELYWRSFDAMVESLLDKGKNVYVLRPVPELQNTIHRLVLLAPDVNQIRGTGEDFFLQRHAQVNQTLEAMQNRVTLLDPGVSLCSNGVCNAVMDSKSLYYDDDHLSPTGARLVTRRYLKTLGLPATR